MFETKLNIDLPWSITPYALIALLSTICMQGFAQSLVDSTMIDSTINSSHAKELNHLEKAKISTDLWFFPDRFLNTSPENYIENYTHEAYVQNETAGDYSRPDDYSISINGASFKWNSYLWNDFSINSLSNPGASLHKIELNNGYMHLNPKTLSLQFYDYNRKQGFARVRGQVSPFFGLVPNASEIAAGITGHSSAFDRKVVDFDYRRHTDYQIASYLYLPNSKGYNQLYFNKGKRYHTSFDKFGLIGQFPEDYFHLNASNKTSLDSKFFSNWYTMFSIKMRDAYQAEWNYEKEETAIENQFALSSFVEGIDKGFNYKAGINISLRSVDRDDVNFYRNMYDIDGEGFEPIYPFANYLEFSPVISVSKSYKESDFNFLRRLKLNAQLENGIIHFDPIKDRQQAYYYFDPIETEGNYTSLYHYDLQSKAFNTLIANDRIGVSWEGTSKKSRFYGGADMQYSGVWSPNVSIADASLDMNIGWETQLRDNLSFGVHLAKRSMPLNYSLVQYLETNYLDGNQNYWNESNDDGVFQAEESSGLFRNYGGGNRSYSSDLKMNKMFSFEAPIKWQVSKVSRLELVGRFNSFRDLWWASYDKPATEYGHFEEVILEEKYFDSDQVFFLDNPDVGYVLKPFDTDLMKDNTENDHFLFENPFYAGATLSYYFQGEKTFIKTSFTAYEVVGPGILGNGAQANSLGVISDNMANPNANIHVLGRLNPDRSYLFSFLLGKKVNEKFNYSILVNYKDGQSFNGYNTSLRNDQIAIWNHGIPGDNPFTGEFNKREDGFWNIELRGEYATTWKNNKVKYYAEIYNFFDIGWEINEYTFRPYINNSRKALDLQIPRGLIFGMDLSL